MTVNAVAPRANTRMTEGLRDYTPEQLAARSPDWIAALVTWLASPEAKHVSGRIFEAWGNGYSVIESWQHGPQAAPSLNPETLGPAIGEIVRFARPNAGIDRNTWLVP